MVLDLSASIVREDDDEKTAPRAVRTCRNCGYTKDEEPGLVMETMVQEKGSDSYRIFLNEFTAQDPRYRHSKTIPCPNVKDCPTRVGGVEGDTIYIKYDPVNLKYLYICNICKKQWWRN